MRLVRNGLFYVLCFGIAAYALFAYGVLPLGQLVHPDMKTNFTNHSIGIYTHIFSSAVALLIGPFQFSQNIRKKHLSIHRWLGRVYLLLGVMVGGLSGLYMSQFAFGGNIAKLGFSMLSIVWLYTGVRAYLAIINGSITEHKNWMMRNFSLTFAAVTLRLYLPTFIIVGIEFNTAYSAIAWLCWVPNLILVEWKYVEKNG